MPRRTVCTSTERDVGRLTSTRPRRLPAHTKILVAIAAPNVEKYLPSNPLCRAIRRTNGQVRSDAGDAAVTEKARVSGPARQLENVVDAYLCWSELRFTNQSSMASESVARTLSPSPDADCVK